ncbi:MAG: sodium:proton antiporter, partial [Gammaproteobacteria bacterium]|nr:sodium:proton antiporter [Gammaproteobacteria bacterium]
ISIAALFSYINHRFFRLPSAIGLMLMALCLSLFILLLDQFGFDLARLAEPLVLGFAFDEALLHGMLGFLLFAGALHVNLNDLAQQKWVIFLLATFGVVFSTFIIGLVTWWLFTAMGFNISFLYCLLFGSLISPTDPIAVLGILKKVGVSKTLETKITGESLFNDGVGVVIFLAILGLITGGGDLQISEVLMLFVIEAVGGVVFGLVIGGIAFYMLRSVNQYQVEILTTLALVMGGYVLAELIHVSAPIAIVVAGLMIGNHGRLMAMSDETRGHVDTFWELLDEILNAILFVMMGLEILIVSLKSEYLIAGLLLIPIVLITRWVSVGLPIFFMRFFREFSPRVVSILTWGGLRGGISVALALSLPAGSERDLILTVTYCVVIFSIMVQGLTIGKLIKKDQ